MKHIISILVVAFFVAVAWWITKSEPLPTDKIIVFTQQSCPHCHEALAFIDAQIKPAYPQIAIEVRDVAEPAHLNQLRTIARREKWENVGTPVIVAGDDKIMGWTTLAEMQLMAAVKKMAGASQAGIASDEDNTGSDADKAAEDTTSANEPEGLCQPGMEEPCL